MNVKKIVTEYLEKHGYGGLCGDECGCLVENLINCDNCCSDCEPGYRIDCDGCGGDFCVSTVRVPGCEYYLSKIEEAKEAKINEEGSMIKENIINGNGKFD